MNSRWFILILLSIMPFPGLSISSKAANAFADNLYKLHQNIIARHDVRTTSEIGGYGGMRGDPEFYKEVKYIDKKTGRLLSTIQWENKNPDKIHTIEVNVYNKSGKVVRDYAAAYLPGKRNAPFQTLVGIYKHRKTLSGYRQYDAAGELLFEQCAGTWEGKKFRIVYEYDEIPDDPIYIKDETESNAYPECFEGFSKHPGKYLNPLSDAKL